MLRAAIVIAIAFAPSAGLRAQPADLPQFDVASVRQVVWSDGRIVRSIQTKPLNLAVRISGGQFRLRTTTLPGLLMDAYNVREDQFTGFPDWAGDTLQYEIVAKAPGRTNAEQVRLMLQSLLADRFKLRLHHETKNLTVYELTVATSGKTPELFPESTAEHRNAWAMMTTLIEDNLDYPLVDKTGLSGYFDSNATLKWNEAQLREELKEARPPSVPPGVAYHGLAPSIFRELEKAYGLTLKRTTAPSDFLVIDHVERPSDN